MEHDMADRTSRILLVEPDADTRGVMTLLFEEAGFEVTHAEGWEQAGAMMAFLRPGLDLVVCEPLQRGTALHDVLAWIAHDEKLQTVPVLICTAAYAKRELVCEYGGRPGREVLFKPFDIADLLAAVARLLDTQARL
jgi:DNA-binding response OmpR family regulator